MTKKLIKSMLVMAMVVTLTCGMASAAEKMKAVEMGESGQVILFAMTPEEIAAEDAETTRLAALRESRSEDPMMLKYELAESGEVVSFPMSAEDIKTAEKQAAEKVAANSVSKHEKVKKPSVVTETCELCESGEIITFTRPNTKAGELPGS